MHTRSLAHLRRGKGAEEAGRRGGDQGEGAEADGRGGGQLASTSTGSPADLCSDNHEGCPEQPQQLQQLQHPSLAGPEGIPDAAKGSLPRGTSGLLLLLDETVVQLEVGGDGLLRRTERPLRLLPPSPCPVIVPPTCPPLPCSTSCPHPDIASLVSRYLDPHQVQEQRLTGLIQALLCGACLAATPVIKQIPTAVMWGYFIFMAIGEMQPVSSQAGV